MMNKSGLCEKIQCNLKVKKIDLSDSEVKALYDATFDSIYQLLEEGTTVEISDFGSFWRKKTTDTSVTFYKPVERVIDRINSDK